MKIRDTLLIGSLISILLIVVFSLMVYVGFNKVAEENERELTAHEIHKTVSELDILLYEYLTYREERMLQQWNLRYDATLEIIEKTGIDEWEAIKSNYADLKDLFSQITVNYEKGDSSELEQRLVAQFLIKSQTIISDSSKIAREAYNNAIEAQKTANTSMIITLVVLFVALIGISLYTARRITQPLEELTKGTEIIGKGNLKHKIDIKSKDEVGELAVAFNEMIDDLKKVTASRDELDKEIREKEKAEEKVKESEEKYRTLIQNSHEIIQSVAPDGHFIFVNQVWFDTLGYTEKEMQSLNIFKIIHPDYLQHCKKIFSKVMAGKPVGDVEAAFVAKDGRKVIVEGNAVPKFFGNKVISTQGFFRDITGKKEAEEELKESEEKYKRLFESSKDAMMTLAPPSWKFTSGNKEIINMFNVKDEKEFTSLGPWDLSPKYQPDGELSSVKAKKMIMEAVKKGSNFFEWTHKRLMGGNFFATVLLTKVELKDQMFLQATVRDITEEKKAEEKKREVLKLKEIDKLKTLFLSTTSHELRTPMTPMKIQMELLLEDHFGKLTKEQRKSLEMVLRNTEHLDKLIADILDISRIQAGRLKFEVEKVQVTDCIKETAENMKPFADKQNIVIATKIAKLPKLTLDKHRIIQVLNNLIKNAIKFTPAKGKITIIAEEQKNDILVKVKDTGIGMSEKDLKRIFEPFFQIDSSYARKYEGTGLGLPICKGIIEQHGGKIWAESIVGKGSSFYFTLPLKLKGGFNK